MKSSKYIPLFDLPRHAEAIASANKAYWDATEKRANSPEALRAVEKFLAGARAYAAEAQAEIEGHKGKASPRNQKGKGRCPTCGHDR